MLLTFNSLYCIPSTGLEATSARRCTFNSLYCIHGHTSDSHGSSDAVALSILYIVFITVRLGEYERAMLELSILYIVF